LCFISFFRKQIKEKNVLTLRPAGFSEAPQSGTSGREIKKILPKRVQQPEIKVMEAKVPVV